MAALYLLSGADALVYQVAWQRILALYPGVGLYSVAVIVAAFLAGLGVGATWEASGARTSRAARRCGASPWSRPPGGLLNRVIHAVSLPSA